MAVLEELNRRNVFRVGAAYVVVSWFLLQASDVIFGVLGVPDWAGKLLAALLAIGIVPVLVFAWVYELSDDGFKRTQRESRDDPRSTATAKRLDIVVIVLLVASLILLFVRSPDDAPPTIEQSASAPVVSDTPQLGQAEASGIRVAVLPFVNMTGDRSSGFFANGLTEEVLNLLAQVESLQVASRTSSFHYGEGSYDLQEAAEQLGVEYILEGSIRRQDDMIRVTAQLIEVEGGFHLWSSTYDRSMGGVFALQDELAGTIASSMVFTLLSEAGQGLIVEIDPHAYSIFLTAKARQNAISAQEVEEAHALFRQVTERAPDFAQGWIGLATTAIVLADVFGRMTEEEAMSLAEDAVSRATSLRPGLREVSFARGRLSQFRYRLTGEEQHLEDARVAFANARRDI